jgi:hypothetical protein
MAEQFDLKKGRAYHGLFDWHLIMWRIGAMLTRRRAIALGSAAALIVTATLSAQAPRTQAPRKPTKAEEAEKTAIYTLVTGVGAGAPNDFSLTWVRDDVLKASDNLEYVPFIVSIDTAKAGTKPLTVYWRVVSTAAPAPAAAAANAKGGNAKAAPAAPVFAWEQITTGTASTTDGAAGRLSRAFTVPAGNYDVYIVVKEPSPEKAAKGAPPSKASVIKKNIDVQDMWNGELNTSSVFVGRIDPLPAPLTPQQATERPYAALGTMEITPDLDTKFTKKGELSTFMLIYNAKIDSANKPDVMIEYNFYARQAGAEKFFNKTNPQNLNAQTLPPQFDFAAGHQLQAGQAVPLATFPEGEYRLEIKVTDKLANKTLTRDVNFSVAGS